MARGRTIQLGRSGGPARFSLSGKPFNTMRWVEPPVTLTDVTLSASTLAEGAAQGTVIGNILGAHADATVTLHDAGGGRTQLDGAVIEAGATPADYEDDPSFNITIRQTLAGATNSPLDTVLPITVTDVAESLIRGVGPTMLGNNASSYAVTVPTAAVSGDKALIFVGHGWNAGTPDGWVREVFQNGVSIIGEVFSKTLDANDISTGTVTVSMGGSYYGALVMIAFVGVPSTILYTSNQQGSVSANAFLSSHASSLTGDTMIWFGSGRAANPVVTCDMGALAKGPVSFTDGGGALYTGAADVGGAVQATFSYSPNSAFFNAIVSARA
jgi:hypothetical protein